MPARITLAYIDRQVRAIVPGPSTGLVSLTATYPSGYPNPTSQHAKLT